MGVQLLVVLVVVGFIGVGCVGWGEGGGEEGMLTSEMIFDLRKKKR